MHCFKYLKKNYLEIKWRGRYLKDNIGWLSSSQPSTETSKVSTCMWTFKAVHLRNNVENVLTLQLDSPKDVFVNHFESVCLRNTLKDNLMVCKSSGM